jgi:DNA polymerase-3 subunit delta'
MSFAAMNTHPQTVALLQRSLERGRVAHAYLLTGASLDDASILARNLIKTLNCRNPVRQVPSQLPTDCCDACDECRRIDQDNHPDVTWVRPESKLRIITIDQMRDLMHTIHLKAMENGYKAGILVGADRLNTQAANAFLKTLEEPPHKSILILLSDDPGRILETILSRCLRLNLGGENSSLTNIAQQPWLKLFCEYAQAPTKNLLTRYQMLGVLVAHFSEIKGQIETNLSASSPLEKYDEAEASLRNKWETELNAAIESEYRHRRAESLAVIQNWLRDVWLETLGQSEARLCFPQFAAITRSVAQNLDPERAEDNINIIHKTRKLLESNVQEALTLEVCLLKLHF